MMTKEAVIALIEDLTTEEHAVDGDYQGACELALDGLVGLGIVSDDGENFDVDLIKLAEYPASVKQFVSGVMATNSAPTQVN